MSPNIMNRLIGPHFISQIFIQNVCFYDDSCLIGPLAGGFTWNGKHAYSTAVPILSKM